MGLRMRLEDDPYSLTRDELMALKSNDQLNSKLTGLLKDAFVHPYSLTRDELMALKSNDQLNSKLTGLLKDAFVQKAVLPARNHWHKL